MSNPLSPSQARAVYGGTVKELSKEMRVDVSTINRWLHGRRCPSLTDAARFLRVCGVADGRLADFADWFEQRA